jgi:hypothetical protein
MMETLMYPPEYYMRVFDQPTQDAVRTHTRAMAEPVVTTSLELYATAREMLYAAADGGSKYALYLIDNMNRRGGWGQIYGCTRTALTKHTHAYFLNERVQNSFGPLRSASIEQAYRLMDEGDFTLYESVVNNNVFLPKVEQSRMRVLSELGSVTGIQRLYLNTVQSKHLTTMGYGAMVNYVLCDRKYVFTIIVERIFEMYQVMKIGRKVNTVELRKYDKFRCYDNNCSKIIGNILDNLPNVTRGTKRTQTNYPDNLSRLKKLLMYIRGSFCNAADISNVQCAKSLFLFTRRRNYHKKAAIVWLLRARRIRICRDVATLIGKFIYAGRFPLLPKIQA